MRILNFGSLNVDHVYKLDALVQPGETKSATAYQKTAGGKGLNQSIALARAGVHVYHAGKIGEDGDFLIKCLEDSGANIELIAMSRISTGHAAIQVNDSGENCIVIYGGANRDIDLQFIDSVLSNFNEGDYLVLQNEINNLPYIMEQAKKRGLKIVFNAAPITKTINEYPLDLVDIFVLNEIEAKAILNLEQTSISPQDLILKINSKYPGALVILTLGAKGACVCTPKKEIITCPGEPADVKDTTAAGDTFIGYFLASYVYDNPLSICLKQACRAASLCVGIEGAARSIPYKKDL